MHLGGGLDRDDQAVVRGRAGSGAEDQGDRGAAGAGFGRQGEPHAAGGAVREEAHRVEGLPGRAGGDEDSPAGEVGRRAGRCGLRALPGVRLGSSFFDGGARGCAAPTADRRGGLRQGFLDRGDQGLVLREAARAHPAAGEFAAARRDDPRPPRPQRLQVGGGRRVLQHVRVHRRGDEERRPAGQGEGRQEVVRQAQGQAGDDVGGGRGDEEEGRLLGEGDVADVRGVVGLAAARVAPPVVTALPVAGRLEEVFQDRFAGDRRQRERGDEGAGGAGQDHLHPEAAFPERPHQLRGAVGADPPGDPQDDLPGDLPLALRHVSRHSRLLAPFPGGWRPLPPAPVSRRPLPAPVR